MRAVLGYKSLFLDETGKADFSHPSKEFVLCGCALDNSRKQELRTKANEIIFKYWGSYQSYRRKLAVKEIVFHAREMATWSGPFIILKDEVINRNFWSDIYSQLLSKTYISYYIVVFDKIMCQKNNWKKHTILRKAYQLALIQFVKHLLGTQSKGEIIAESSYDQDLSLVSALNTLQRNSHRYFKRKKISETLTTLTLVNKYKNEIGAQIADIMAWTGKNKFLIDRGYKKLNQLTKEELRHLEMFKKRLKSGATRYKFNFYKKYP